MQLKSFSKINLTLQVSKKNKKNNLHDIQSYYCLIDLHDKINVKVIRGRKDKIRFYGKFAKNVSHSKNSVKDVLIGLRKRNLIFKHYSISIKKNIPVFGGLGGGSSNAAFLTKHFVGKKIKNSFLNGLSEKIGSDFKLFFCNQAFMKNLNEIIKFKKKHSLYFLLVYPNIRCSTKNIYSKITKYSSKSILKFNKINTKNKFLKFLVKKDNDLQNVVEKKYPKIKRLINEIGQFRGCYFSRLTGSGSVCYGVFKSKIAAKNALSRVKLKYPKYWSSFAKTI